MRDFDGGLEQLLRMHDPYRYFLPRALRRMRTPTAQRDADGHPDELNTLNIKLFPIYPAPPPVKAWQVPLFTVRYQTFMDENWDLTMQRVRRIFLTTPNIA